MKKKFFILIMLFAFFAVNVHSAELTTANNGINGEIIVKYNNKENPLVLIEGQMMNLTITVEKTETLTDPKMYVSLYDNGRLVNVYISDGADLGTEYTFQKNIQLPDDLSGHFAKVFLWENGLTPMSNDLKLLTVLHPVFYTYDFQNRIDTIKYFDKTITYLYDYNGNLLSRTTTTDIDTQSFASVLNIELPIPQNFSDSINESNKNSTPLTEIDPVVLKALVSVELVDDIWVTVYDLSLLDEEDFLDLTE